MAFRFLERGLEHLPPSAETPGVGRDDDAAHAHGAVLGGVGEKLELAAVLVTAGIMREQVADGEEVEPFQRLEPRRTQTRHVGERRGERKGRRGLVHHGIVPVTGCDCAARRVRADIFRHERACRRRGQAAWWPDVLPIMKRFLLLLSLVIVIQTFGGCAFMGPDDREFFGKGWISPKELDTPAGARHTPDKTTTPVAPDTDAPLAPANSAWDVPGGMPQ